MTSTLSMNDNKLFKYKKYQSLKENENFLYKLKEFHKLRGTPINNFPTLNGKSIDLYALYLKVTSHGGWEKVCEKEKWDEISNDFNIKSNCLNGSYGLKNIYLRYLSLYERVTFFGEETTSKEEDDENSRRKFSNILHSIPMTYNIQQHLCTLNEINKSKHLKQFEKLELSLICGLPNEIDFVFNTLLMISSNTNNNDIDLLPIYQTQSIRLIDLLLAHVGFFSDDIYNYRKLYNEWREYANRNFVKFWHDTIESDDDYINSLLPVIYNKCINDLPSTELLNLRQEYGFANFEAYRIEQAMVIINNFSFDDKNLEYLCQSKTLIKFLLLTSYCTYYDIRKLSLDILSNLCKKIILTTLTQSEIKSLFNKIGELIQSSDRYEIIRGLEILTKLCLSTNENEDIIKDNLNEKFYELVNQLLTVQDLLIITYSLECLYQLSQFSDGYVCEQFLNSSKSLISLLIDYLTVDSSHFASNSIKVVEIMQPVVVQHQQFHQMQPHSPIQPIQQNKIHNMINTINIPILHQSHPTPITASLIMNPQDQQSKMQVSNWLRMAFNFNQALNNQPISKTELYVFYKNHAKVNNWNILSIPTFFDILMSTFPQIRTDDNKNAIYGLKPVNSQQPIIISQPQQTVVQLQITPQTVLVPQPQQQQQQAPPPIIQIKAPIMPTLHVSPAPTPPPSEPSVIKKEDEQITIANMNESSCSSIESSTSTSSAKYSTTVKLEKVGEAIPAFSLCDTLKMEEIKCAKIERLINDAHLKMNGNGNSGGDPQSLSNGDCSLSSSSSSSLLNKNNEVKVNEHVDHVDADATSTLKPHLNGLNTNKNGKIIPKSQFIEKINDELNAKIKRKLSQNTEVQHNNNISNNHVNDENSTLTPTKKKAKKINEMNLEPTTQTPPPPPSIQQPSTSIISAVLNKPPLQQPSVSNTPPPSFQQQQQQSQNTTIFVTSLPIQQQQQQQNILIATSFDYMCEWNSCKMYFNSSKAVLNHVYKTHLNNYHNFGGSYCLWHGCDQTKRQKWALFSHIQERHCNEQALRNSCIYRQKGLVQPPTQLPPQQQQQVVYNKDAALFAIQRLQRASLDEFLLNDETPVTKSIHLLSALSLRNFTIKCPLARRQIKHYESFLCTIAFSNLESSNAIANCLWQLRN